MRAPVIVAVASGKGGVGKSTVSLNLALALSREGSATGLLDADLYGPDIPLMVGITRRQPTKSVTVWRDPGQRRPIEPLERFGIKVMSAQFLVAEDQALSWSAPLVQLLLQRFTHDVAWGEIDFLIVDLPPGTADIQQQLARHLGLSGALIVVTPQDAAHLDAKKVLAMFEQMSVPVIGGVDNMSGLVCPSCQSLVDVFPPVAAERSIWAAGVERLVGIPIHPPGGRRAGPPADGRASAKPGGRRTDGAGSPCQILARSDWLRDNDSAHGIEAEVVGRCTTRRTDAGPGRRHRGSGRCSRLGRRASATCSDGPKVRPGRLACRCG